MFSKNLFGQVLFCEHPQTIRNVYNGKLISVPCGHCKTCLLNKGQRGSSMCSLEETLYKYCYFVTLTYSDLFIPRMRFDESENGYVLRGNSPRCKDDYNKELSYCLGNVDISQLQVKCGLNGDMSYLCTKDLQNFFKRLRKRIGKYTTSKISYYAAGEYGPNTFRSHWHIILYFDDEQISEKIIENVCQSWKFGNVDVSASRGSCGSYVSEYINNVSVIPSVLKTGKVRPRSYHSSRFGFRLFKPYQEEIYEKGFEFFNGFSYKRHGAVVNVIPPSNIRHYFFPKCQGFNDDPPHKLFDKYTIYYRLRQVYPNLTKSQIINNFVDACYHRVPFCFFTKDGSIQKRNVDKLLYSWMRDPVTKAFDKKQLKNWFYSIIHLSYHFVVDLCHNDKNLFNKRIEQIQEFYHKAAQSRLSKFYQAEEEYMSIYHKSAFSNGYLLFYDNAHLLYPDISPTLNPVWIKKRNDNWRRLCENNKTKKQNDKNGIFLQQLENT